MKKINEVSEPVVDWPVSFAQVEDAQLKEMLKATPEQCLAMAEELLKFAIEAKSAKF